MDFSKNPVINIISKREKRNWQGGPGSVVGYTLKQFDIFGQRYVINKKMSNYFWNWVHDDVRGVIAASVAGIPAIFGPNLVNIPSHLPKIMPKPKGAFLLPSKWVADMWYSLGFRLLPLEVWPVGIPLEPVRGYRYSKSIDVLIYHKQRDEALLDEVLGIVSKLGFKPVLIKYGSYKRDEYLTIASSCLFGVWLGRSETQGIALLEALSMDLPLIVLDVKNANDNTGIGTYRFPRKIGLYSATGAPYFDDRCGIIVKQVNELANAIKELVAKIEVYKPREYIETDLSLSTSTQKLIKLFHKYCPVVDTFNVSNSIETFNLGTIESIVYGSNKLITRLVVTIERMFCSD